MKIKVEAVINVNIEKVWEHWSSPQSIMGWAFASDDWECTHAENDLGVGGKFLTRMSAKDKSVSFDFVGAYLEIENKKDFKKIHYVMENILDAGDKRECVVIFEKLSESETKVSEEFDPESINPLEMQKAGWQAILGNFKKYAESNDVLL